MQLCGKYSMCSFQCFLWQYKWLFIRYLVSFTVLSSLDLFFVSGGSNQHDWTDPAAGIESNHRPQRLRFYCLTTRWRHFTVCQQHIDGPLLHQIKLERKKTPQNWQTYYVVLCLPLCILNVMPVLNISSKMKIPLLPLCCHLQQRFTVD